VNGLLSSATDATVVDVVTPMVDAIVSNPMLLAIVVIAILLNAFSRPAKRRRRR
jgi:hypothetical protein